MDFNGNAYGFIGGNSLYSVAIADRCLFFTQNQQRSGLFVGRAQSECFRQFDAHENQDHSADRLCQQDRSASRPIIRMKFDKAPSEG